MNRCLAGLLVILFSLLIVGTNRAEARRSMQWYQNVYGSIAPGDHRLAAKAFNVFARVMAVADKSAESYPKLLIVPARSNPWALCLEDGGIVLSRSALEFCYRDVPEHIGSARLAFVFSHEIAHLAKGDFWHADIAEFIQRIGPEEKGLEEFHKLNKNPENIKLRELKADYHGLIYASMAGYKLQTIIQNQDLNFFRAWTNQLQGKIAYDAQSYPSPELRAKYLLVALENIYDQIEIFQLSLRLYQKGDYDDALKVLSDFQRQFPCREVFNNIGLIHYQKAMDLLDRADRAKSRRFKLATVLDAETRARKNDAGPSTSEKKALNDNFQKEISAAVTNFEAACEKDHYYLPARMNLASAHIVKEEYSKALAILEDAEKLSENNLHIANNHAVALYLFGRRQRIDTTRPAVEILQRILTADSDYAAAWYNLGRIEFEQAKPKKAGASWMRFMKNEPSGRYAAQALESIGGRPTHPTPQATKFETPPPIELGYIEPETRRKLTSFSSRELNSGSLAGGVYYTQKEIKVWVMERYVKYVETPLTRKMNISEVFSIYGKPNKIIVAASGLQTLVYDDFALDVEHRMAVNVVYFLYL